MTSTYTNNMTSSNPSQSPLQSGFLHWITLQRADLEKLLTVPETDAELLRHVTQKTIQHLNDYQQTRSALSIYAPSSFENAMFWIGGFKPSIYIRLVYSISDKFEFEHLKLFNGERVMECSDMQVKLIKGLHAETVKSEDEISFRMGNLQECMEIEPLMINGSEGGVDTALAAHRVAFNEVVMDADELRVKVLKELVDHILIPLQGVHLLVALTRLHLSIHEWGNK